MDKVLVAVGIIFLVVLGLFIPLGVPLVIYGQEGAVYKVQLGNVSQEQCSYATTSVKDIRFLDVTTSTDPCTLKTIYWYNYQVTWKANAEDWLLVHLGKDGIAPISIETGERK
jgi:hypothetical protein